MSKRKTYEVGNKWNNPALTQMRNAAFGNGMCLHIHKTLDRSERMRDDAGMLEAAAAKRARKAAKRVKS